MPWKCQCGTINQNETCDNCFRHRPEKKPTAKKDSEPDLPLKPELKLGDMSYLDNVRIDQSRGDTSNTHVDTINIKQSDTENHKYHNSVLPFAIVGIVGIIAIIALVGLFLMYKNPADVAVNQTKVQTSTSTQDSRTTSNASNPPISRQDVSARTIKNEMIPDKQDVQANADGTVRLPTDSGADKPVAKKPLLTGLKWKKIIPGVFFRPDGTYYQVIINQKRQIIEIKHPYLISTTEVTQRAWQEIMKNNPSINKGPDLPVENVSWYEIQDFLKRLNEKAGKKIFRLPTEDEWEYACRADTKTRWHCGEDHLEMTKYAWYKYNAGGKSHAVGTKSPNPWGLYDMSGNVKEWVDDWYGRFYSAGNKKTKVIRGGSWYSTVDFIASDARFDLDPHKRAYDLGFRIVMDIDQTRENK